MEFPLCQAHEHGNLLAASVEVLNAECIHCDTFDAEVQAPLQGFQKLEQQGMSAHHDDGAVNVSRGLT